MYTHVLLSSELHFICVIVLLSAVIILIEGLKFEVSTNLVYGGAP